MLDMPNIYLTGKTLEELKKATNHLNSVKIKRYSDNYEDWKLFALSKLSPEDFQKCLSMMSENTKAKYKNIKIRSKK